MNGPTHVGPYLLHEAIGRGGAGVVYRGVHTETGQVAAVKVLHQQETRDRQSLQREIDVLTALSHPGIVRILDQGETGGQRWIATELLAGGTLRDSLRPAPAAAETFDFDLDLPASTASEDTPWDPDPTVLRALGQLAHAVAWLHGEGVVHRDLKPENVMLVDGQAVLLDFGMATLTHSRDAPERLPGGTVGYMAPEQARGEAVDPRADLYALGCMLYEALTGRLPQTPPDPLPQFDALVRPLLAPKPEDRRLQLDPLTRALGVERVGPIPRQILHRPPLVARTEVAAAIDRSIQAKRGTMLITGPSGIGRTRIAMELFGRARRSGWPATAGHRPGPLGPFLPLVRAAANLPMPTAPARAAFAAVAHFLDVATSHSMPGPLEAEPSRTRLIEGVAVAMAAVCDKRPLAILLDDLHDADPLTVEAACRLGRVINQGDADCALLATWNTDVSEPPPIVLRNLGAPNPLQRLGQSELERLASAAAPGLRASTQQVAIRLCEGLPLLCMEGLRIPRGGTLAETFEERSMTRLMQLPAPSRALVEAAAVGDADVDASALGDCVGLDGRSLSIALHEARCEGFLELDDGAARLTHQRLRDVVLAGLEPTERQRLHANVARHTAGAARARHLEAANRIDDARQAWTELVHGAPDPLHRRLAVRHLVALWDGPLPPWLELKRAQAARAEGDRSLAMDHARRVLGAEPPLHIEALMIIAQGLPRTDPEVGRCLSEARQLADAHQHTELAIDVRLIEQQIARRLGKPLEPILDALTQVRTLIPTSDRNRRLREAHEHGSALLAHGRNAEAAKVMTSGLPHLDGADIAIQCAFLGNLGAARWQAFDLVGALQATLANLRTAAQHGVTGSLRSAMINLALAMSGMGDSKASEGLLGGALALSVDDDEGRVGVIVRAADVLMSHGEFNRATPMLQVLLTHCQQAGDRLHEFEVCHRLARCLLMKRQFAEAQAVLVDVPNGLRDDPQELRDLAQILQGQQAPLPTTASAALVLGLVSEERAHHLHTREVFVSTFEAFPLAIHRQWATHFGAEGLLEAASPEPLPPEIEALCRPLGDAAGQALRRLQLRT